MARVDPVDADLPGFITVSLVWSELDWPEPPLTGGQTAYSLTPMATGPVPTPGDSSPLPEMPILPTIFIRECRLPAGQTLAETLAAVLSDSAGRKIESGRCGVSVFGRKPRLTQQVLDGDRIELLGPITADPKSERRARVKADRARGGRSPWSRQAGRN